MIARIGRSTRVEMRQRALAAGQRAEVLAALYLRLKGYRILARRYCVRGGEIDLIARAGSTIAFIEVKYRPNVVAGDDGHRWRETNRRVVPRRSALACGNPWAARLTLRGDAVYLAPRHWRTPCNCRDEPCFRLKPRSRSRCMN